MLGSSFMHTQELWPDSQGRGVQMAVLCCAGCEVCLALYPAFDRGQQQMPWEGGQEAEQV